MPMEEQRITRWMQYHTSGNVAIGGEVDFDITGSDAGNARLPVRMRIVRIIIAPDAACTFNFKIFQRESRIEVVGNMLYSLVLDEFRTVPSGAVEYVATHLPYEDKDTGDLSATDPLAGYVGTLWGRIEVPVGSPNASGFTVKIAFVAGW